MQERVKGIVCFSTQSFENTQTSIQSSSSSVNYTHPSITRVKHANWWNLFNEWQFHFQTIYRTLMKLEQKALLYICSNENI